MPKRETSVLLLLTAISVISGCSAWKCPIDTPPTLIPNGEYRPRGKVLSAVGMKVYEVGSDNSSHILIGIHDIFGIGPNTNTKEVCDILADGGIKVILPDFFHGNAWNDERLGPHNTSSNPAFVAFLEKYSWEKSIRKDLTQLIRHYKRRGFAKFGIFGYRFGGRQVLYASEEFSDRFLVAGQFSPVPAFTAQAHRIKVPTAIFYDIPRSETMDVTEYCKIISSNLGEGSCVGKDFNNTKYVTVLGGAEADWTNKEIRVQAADSLLIFQQFLCTKFLG